MLLTLIFCHLSVLVVANPFHKYPFVFLLDVGNEELQKTNSEQIRVSAPGGSIALRYPAIGYGNTIGHVRVSGIDFGTDLKANIVDGGPGYKYFILVFMGNPGTPYDAVVTVQTVIDNGVNTQNVENDVNSEPSTNQSEKDANNSAEDLSDAEVSNDVQNVAYIQNANAELMQSSSNIYSYVNNESIDDTEDDDSDDDNDDANNEGNSNNIDEETENSQVYSDETGEESVGEDFEDVSNAKDIHTQYAEDIDKDDSNIEVKNIDQEDDDDDEQNYDEEVNFKADHAEKPPVVINRNSYQALQDHLNFGNEVYSQEEFQDSSRPVYQEDPLDYENPYGEEINDGQDKYRDSNNNNYLNSDDSYAVAY